jgi:hypothetical protein
MMYKILMILICDKVPLDQHQKVFFTIFNQENQAPLNTHHKSRGILISS